MFLNVSRQFCSASARQASAISVALFVLLRRRTGVGSRSRHPAGFAVQHPPRCRPRPNRRHRLLPLRRFPGAARARVCTVAPLAGASLRVSAVAQSDSACAPAAVAHSRIPERSLGSCRTRAAKGRARPKSVRRRRYGFDSATSSFPFQDSRARSAFGVTPGASSPASSTARPRLPSACSASISM